MIKKIEIKKMLIVEKYTSFEYSQKKGKVEKISKERFEDLKKSHDEHKIVKELTLQLLERNKIKYELVRDNELEGLNYDVYDAVMSLGGDGTALHAMSKITNQFFCGVNTDTKKSLGKLTKLNLNNLESALKQFLSGENNVELWDRLSAKVNNEKIPYFAVNEILIADPRIYKTTHLEFEIGKEVSSTISNGIIIATSQGSSAFYKSSGGEEFKTDAIGYNVIMPFKLEGTLEKLKIISIDEKVVIRPKREHYKLIFDCHEKRAVKLNHGDIIEISANKKDKIKIIV